jgi:hypothetical protein
MQKTAEKEKELPKDDYYVPMGNPTANKVYQLIKWYETEILFLVAFTIPSVELRERMNESREIIKRTACRNCQYLGQLKQSELQVQVFPKDDQLSSEHGKIVKTEQWIQSKRCTMACEGCRVLRLKQIATGYIKGRRFKQV